MNQPDLVRAFVALELPDSLRAALAELTARLKAASPPVVRWLDSTGMHLTLKFLGNISSTSVDDIQRALGSIAAGSPPFHLKCTMLGAFPNVRAPRVVWVGLEGELEPLRALQAAVEDAMEKLGHPREGRSFEPHLTLGRVREGASPLERRALGQVVTVTPSPGLPGWRVDDMSLMRSQLSRAGAVYTRIAGFRLEGGLSHLSPWVILINTLFTLL